MVEDKNINTRTGTMPNYTRTVTMPNLASPLFKFIKYGSIIKTATLAGSQAVGDYVVSYLLSGERGKALKKSGEAKLDKAKKAISLGFTDFIWPQILLHSISSMLSKLPILSKLPKDELPGISDIWYNPMKFFLHPFEEGYHLLQNPLLAWASVPTLAYFVPSVVCLGLSDQELEWSGIDKKVKRDTYADEAAYLPVHKWWEISQNDRLTDKIVLYSYNIFSFIGGMILNIPTFIFDEGMALVKIAAGLLTLASVPLVALTEVVGRPVRNLIKQVYLSSEITLPKDYDQKESFQTTKNFLKISYCSIKAGVIDGFSAPIDHLANALHPSYFEDKKTVDNKVEDNYASTDAKNTIISWVDRMGYKKKLEEITKYL